MAYFDQAALSTDQDFAQRIAACAAVEVELGDTHPYTWATAHQWTVAAAPGFADAYASAVAGEVDHPGADPSVISDAQILAAVQAIIDPPDPPDDPPPIVTPT
jgi:hypothetical protein